MSDDEAISDIEEDSQKSEISDNEDSDVSTNSISSDSDSDSNDQDIDGAEDKDDEDSDNATVISSRHKYVTPSFMSKTTSHINTHSNIINPDSSRVLKVTPYEEMRTISTLSINEYAALMIARIKALEDGDAAYVDVTKFNNPESIAKEEIITGKCNLLIKRVVGRGFVEIVSPNPLTKFIT